MHAIDFTQLERRQRAHCINCLSGYKSANLVGTESRSGQSNLAIFSSFVHLGADPALIGFVSRPDSVQRHSYENILQTKRATLNHVNKNIYREAHQTSARYDREVSEFEAVGLTAQYIDDFHAPFVEQSHLKIALSMVDAMPIKYNGTVFVVMKIEQVYAAKDIVQDDGYLDIQQLDTVVVSGLDTYHSVDTLARLPYAKP